VFGHWSCSAVVVYPRLPTGARLLVFLRFDYLLLLLFHSRREEKGEKAAGGRCASENRHSTGMLKEKSFLMK